LLCRNLVDLALQRGGHDNATVVSVIMGDPALHPRQGMFTKMGRVLADLFVIFERLRKKAGL
jgi:hypothetical protein